LNYESKLLVQEPYHKALSQKALQLLLQGEFISQEQHLYWTDF